MKIRDLIWPEDRIDHITSHGIEPEEVEEACFGEALVLRARTGGKNPVHYVFGQTESGRHLFCVVIQFPGRNGYPVTARPMTRPSGRAWHHNANHQREAVFVGGVRDWQPFHGVKNLSMSIAIEAAELMERFQRLTAEEAVVVVENPAERVAVADEAHRGWVRRHHGLLSQLEQCPGPRHYCGGAGKA